MVTIKHSEKLMKIKINTAIAKYKTSAIFRGFVATLIGSGASKILFVAVTFVGSNVLWKEQFGELSFVRNTLDMFLCVCALNYSSLCTKLTTEAYKQDRRARTETTGRQCAHQCCLPLSSRWQCSLL